MGKAGISLSHVQGALIFMVNFSLWVIFSKILPTNEFADNAKNGFYQKLGLQRNRLGWGKI